MRSLVLSILPVLVAAYDNGAYWGRCLKRPLRIGDSFRARGHLEPGVLTWVCSLEQSLHNNIFARAAQRNWYDLKQKPYIVYVQRAKMGAFGGEHRYNFMPFPGGGPFEITMTIVGPRTIRVDYGKGSTFAGTTWTQKGVVVGMDVAKSFDCIGQITNVTLTGDALVGKMMKDSNDVCPPYSYWATHPDPKPHPHEHSHSHDWSGSSSAEWPDTHAGYSELLGYVAKEGNDCGASYAVYRSPSGTDRQRYDNVGTGTPYFYAWNRNPPVFCEDTYRAPRCAMYDEYVQCPSLLGLL
ncbi:unnamed protein product, partial [Mesorhabditis spiculigera]